MAGSGRWLAVHPSEFPHEQQALDLLRERLPDTSPFRGWSNFEFLADDGSINEIDALVVSTDCIYLIEIKHWSGDIHGNQNTWTVRSPTGRVRHEENPLLLANRKARKLKSLLQRQKAFQNHKLRVPYIQAVVFLSSANCRIHLDANAGQHIYPGPEGKPKDGHSIIGVIQGKATEGDGRPGIDRATERALVRAMEQLGLRKRTGAATVGDYQLTGLIGENDQYQDWQAHLQRLDKDLKRIRVFPYRRQAADAEKRERKDLATREYKLLGNVHHDGILSPRHLTESEVGPALVYDFDPDAERLDHLFDTDASVPSIDARLDLVRKIAEALAYAHGHNIHHRALSPWTIELHEHSDGRRQPVIRDWQSGIAQRETTADTRMTMHAGQQAGVIDNPRAEVYAAPEVVAGDGYDPVAIDIFSLGALTYALFSGRHPAGDVEQMLDKCQSGPGLLLSGVLDGTPDSLQELIQLCTDPNPAERPGDVREFLALLDRVEDELTTPEPEQGVRPADASTGDKLTGGFEVLHRLGSGSTCHALAVESADGQQGVLKVAKEPSFNERLDMEAETLAALHHPNIVKCLGRHEIDGLTAIFIEQAGDQTMGRELRDKGPLSLDSLERFGDELLGALVYLEREGVNHRDIKPENIGVGETGKRARTLKLFDFSLSHAATNNIRAGTTPYLDPFLRLRRPQRWDLGAERFAAAMTLHEMATGSLPSWGEAGQDPASSDEPVRLDIERFDASVRDSLAAFFQRALERDNSKRFDNADDMQLAWKNLFRHIDQTRHGEDTDDGTLPDFSQVRGLSRATPLATLGLSARVLNAADRIGATTVGELLALPNIRFHRNRGFGHRITRQLGRIRKALAECVEQAPAARNDAGEASDKWSIELLVKALDGIQLADTEADIIRHWLGLADASNAGAALLASPGEVASATAATRDEVRAAIDKAAGKWAKNRWMTMLRDELAGFLLRREYILSVAELADMLLHAHGSTAAGPERQRLAEAAIQAALEVEAARASARFVLYRGHSLPLVIATPDLDSGLAAPAAERAEYAKALAASAHKLASEDPLPSPRRVEERLLAIAPPKGDPPMSSRRRIRLAAAAAPDVALSSRQELYPAGLSAERALRLGANSLLGAKRLDVAQLQARIRSRFPQAERLPGRPALDRLLQTIDFPLIWHQAGDGLRAGYAVRRAGATSTDPTSTLARRQTATHGTLDDSPPATRAQAFEATLTRALASGRTLLVSADIRRMREAAEQLATRFGLTPLSFDRLLIEALQAEAKTLGADWAVVRRADAAAHASADCRRLQQLVARVMPAITAQLREHPEPLLLQHLGLLVRYGQTGLIQTLRDDAAGGQRPARILLLPGDRQQPPRLDGHTLPVITPADWAHLPRAWLENRHRASAEGQRA